MSKEESVSSVIQRREFYGIPLIRLLRVDGVLLTNGVIAQMPDLRLSSEVPI